MCDADSDKTKRQQQRPREEKNNKPEVKHTHNKQPAVHLNDSMEQQKKGNNQMPNSRTIKCTIRMYMC